MAYKSADEARAAAMKPKRGLPKGGGKGLKGSNLYTPVSQGTIDSIKKAGMAASLKKAATSSDASYVQGVKRMYGADRLAKAKASAKVVAKSPDAARAGSMKPVKPVAKSADAARAAATKTSSTRMGANTVMAAKPTVRTSGTTPKRKPATNPAAQAIVNILSGKGLKSNNGMTAAQVAAENKRRAAAVAAAKKNK
jgi:hypothetical protein